jgi:hypothetical protein
MDVYAARYSKALGTIRCLARKNTTHKLPAWYICTSPQVLLRHLLTNISKLTRSQKSPCRPEVIKHIDSCKKTMSDLGLLPPGQLPALVFPLPLLLQQSSMLQLSPSYMISTTTCWQLHVPLQRRVRLPPVKQGLSPRLTFTFLHLIWLGLHHHHDLQKYS